MLISLNTEYRHTDLSYTNVTNVTTNVHYDFTSVYQPMSLSSLDQTPF